MSDEYLDCTDKLLTHIFMQTLHVYCSSEEFKDSLDFLKQQLSGYRDYMTTKTFQRVEEQIRTEIKDERQ